MPQPVRPESLLARDSISFARSLEIEIFTSIPRPSRSMLMSINSAGDETSSSVTLNPTAKSSRSAGVAIITTWGTWL